jgi:hypothetical protein
MEMKEKIMEKLFHSRAKIINANKTRKGEDDDGVQLFSFTRFVSISAKIFH